MYVDEIRAYTPQNEQEAADQRLILEYIRLFPDNILTRDNEIAHLSSSGFVVNADGTRCSWPTTIFTGCGPGRAAMRMGRATCSPCPAGGPGGDGGGAYPVPSAPPSPSLDILPCGAT